MAEATGDTGGEKTPTGGQAEEIIRDIRDTVEGDESAVENAVRQQGPRKSKYQIEKSFGLMGCVAIIIGSVMGSGIFGAPNLNVVAVDSLAISILIWLRVGVIVTVGALCYVEIGCTFPLSGGDYSYLTVMYGVCGGCLYQWASNVLIM